MIIVGYLIIVCIVFTFLIAGLNDYFQNMQTQKEINYAIFGIIIFSLFFIITLPAYIVYALVSKIIKYGVEEND